MYYLHWRQDKREKKICVSQLPYHWLFLSYPSVNKVSKNYNTLHIFTTDRIEVGTYLSGVYQIPTYLVLSSISNSRFLSFRLLYILNCGNSIMMCSAHCTFCPSFYLFEQSHHQQTLLLSFLQKVHKNGCTMTPHKTLLAWETFNIWKCKKWPRLLTCHFFGRKKAARFIKH